MQDTRFVKLPLHNWYIEVFVSIKICICFIMVFSHIVMSTSVFSSVVVYREVNSTERLQFSMLHLHRTTYTGVSKQRQLWSLRFRGTQLLSHDLVPRLFILEKVKKLNRTRWLTTSNRWRRFQHLHELCVSVCTQCVSQSPRHLILSQSYLCVMWQDVLSKLKLLCRNRLPPSDSFITVKKVEDCSGVVVVWVSHSSR